MDERVRGGKMKKIMIVFGTRPEAIKMCPLIKELEKHPHFQTIVCVTGQHRQMLDQVLEVFQIQPDYDLNIMKEKQTLADVTSNVLDELTPILAAEQPNIVLVHGDTTTTYATSLASFYQQIDVGHIEAGLRTYDLTSPYPEEFNRQSVSLMAKYHFAPTQKALNNLISEGKSVDNVYITGNTAIDALNYTISNNYQSTLLQELNNKKIILLTAHRRENLGQPMKQMFQAVKKIAEKNKDVAIIYPMHLNPQVRKLAKEILGNQERVRLIEPLDVFDFQNLLARSYLVLTDSGGIQEEAPALNIPVLVMRETTERPEGVESGTLKLVGTDEKTIYQSCQNLLDNEEAYQKMATAINPYGDGTASKKYVIFWRKNYNEKSINLWNV